MSMKYIVRIAAPLGVAFALVLAGTIPAFAAWGDSTYAIWRDISAAMPGQSPHGDYDTSTRKCGVCHSVHAAKPTGQVLLQSSIADACSYCHVVAGVSDIVVYDGLEANYKGTDWENAHNTGYPGSTNGGCVDCHQVHAASTRMTNNLDLTDKILWGEKESYFFDPKYDPVAGAPLATDTKATALSKWCTKCHVGGLTGYGFYATEYPADPLEGLYTHVMKDPEVYTRGSIAPTEVAYVSSQQCSSCHTSGYGTSKWPHYTQGARFLVQAGDKSAAQTPVSPGMTSYDGVCLRCHRDGARGVGLTW